MKNTGPHLASMIDIPVDAIVRPLLIESRSVPIYCCLIDETELDDGLPWYHDIYHDVDLHFSRAPSLDQRDLLFICEKIVLEKSESPLILLYFKRENKTRKKTLKK